MFFNLLKLSFIHRVGRRMLFENYRKGKFCFFFCMDIAEIVKFEKYFIGIDFMGFPHKISICPIIYNEKKRLLLLAKVIHFLYGLPGVQQFDRFV